MFFLLEKCFSFRLGVASIWTQLSVVDTKLSPGLRCPITLRFAKANRMPGATLGRFELPLCLGRLTGVRGSERELRRQLNSARSATSKERIADTHIACGHNLISTIAHFMCLGSVQREPTPAGL
jgi:hypothetical protein